MGEGSEKNPIISLPLAVALLILFSWAGLEAFEWSPWVRQFLLTIAVPGTVITLIALYQDSKSVLVVRRDAESWLTAIKAATDKAVLDKAGIFFGYLIALILVTLVIGQQIALCLFIATYLWRWGKYGWRVSIGYAVVGWIILYGFYDQVMHILWHPSWLFG